MNPRPSWHPDPLRRFEFRYWDGTRWTDHVSSGGRAEVDQRPVVTDPEGAVELAGHASDDGGPTSARLMSKAASALIEQPSFQVPRLGEIALEEAGAESRSVDWVLEQYRRRYGGLWVGGRVTLTSKSIAFSPNALNRATHAGTLDVDIPLALIVRVDLLPGVVTKIVAIHTVGGLLKVRCYGASNLAHAIEKACSF